MSKKPQKLIAGHKTRIKTNASLSEKFKLFANARRFCYNQAVEICWEILRENHVENDPTKWLSFLNGRNLRDRINKEKVTNPNFEWIVKNKISSHVPAIAAFDCFDAFNRCVTHHYNGTTQKAKNSYINKCERKGIEVDGKRLDDIGKPNFQKKEKNERFSLANTVHFIEGKPKSYLNMPSFPLIKLSEKLKEVPKKVTISEKNGEWYLSSYREIEVIKTPKKKVSIGADGGVKTLVTLSDGTVYENKKFAKKSKQKIAFLKKSCNRKFDCSKKPEEQSNNYKKQSLKLAKEHEKIARKRRDFIHKVTTEICKNHDIVCIETLKLANMLKNRKLAFALCDASLYEFRRQIEYKCKWYGSEFVKVPTTFPSSQFCSCCGQRKTNLTLSVREFVCEGCGLVIDRDLNAAINIEREGLKILAAESR